MYLAAPQLESVLLKRLENWQSSGSAPTLGLAHCLTSVLQANSSAAGLEWSSTDGHDEAAQESVKVDLQDAALSQQLAAWLTWLAPDGAVGKPQYYAAAHALAQDILSAVLNSSSGPVVQRSALDAAWQEDAPSGGDSSIPADRFKGALAALATACCADGTPQAAAACLGSLLPKLQSQGPRWQGLVDQYSRAAGASATVGVGAGTSAAAAAAGEGDDEDDDDIEALLREDDSAPDVSPASDKSPSSSIPGGPQQQQQPSAFASAAAASGEEGARDVSAAAASGGATRRQRQASSKFFDEDDLPLSGTTSADLGELPADLDAPDPNRQHRLAGKASPERLPAKPALADMMASEGGKGNLAELPTDPYQWASFKDKQQPGGATARRAGGRNAAPLIPLPGRGDAAGSGKQAPDQHLKAARGGEGQPPLLNARTDGPKSNPLHNAIINSSAVRQSVDREAAAAAAAAGGTATLGGGNTSRHGSNGSPVRQRSLASCTNLSRKVSVSEPGPMGPQAEWKHLPALGQASRLHPHEMRQASQAQLRAAAGNQVQGGKGPVPYVTAVALVEPKLPSLPSLGGARGPPPKAMELLRRPSQAGPRTSEHYIDNAHHASPNPHLPGLNGGPGGLRGPQGPRQLRMPSKKSFRGDSNF